jgi:2-polyprenyl-3-methyl-5-hydroxy-6-metoxy-1,4-benzoquinol methylase
MIYRQNPFVIGITSFLILFSAVYAEVPSIKLSRLEKLKGKKLSVDNKSNWDRFYKRRSYVYGRSPSPFLAKNYHFIPFGAKVLDIGMGEGQNAVFLAQKGYQVTGIDISTVAIRKAQYLAKEYGVRIKTITGSVEKYRFKKHSFDAILIFHYVDKAIVDLARRWLKPGGVLIMEAYTMEQKDRDNKKEGMEKAYVRKGELLEKFSKERILKFEEPIHKKKFTSSLIVKVGKEKI